LLRDDDPWVRKSAATAIGYVKGDRSAELLMTLFEDPDDRVRSTAVFMMACLRYKPALEDVKRLTRDRSKEVREWARRAVRDLTAECP
jgi:HEAT repeat protein